MKYAESERKGLSRDHALRWQKLAVHLDRLGNPDEQLLAILPINTADIHHLLEKFTPGEMVERDDLLEVPEGAIRA